MLTYALIVSKRGKRDSIYSRIQEIGQKNVNRLYKVYGEYDLLLGVKVQSEEKLKELMNGIKGIEGVILLKTFKVLHKTYEHDILPKI